MPLLPRLASLWHNLFHKTKREDELAAEVDSYLEMLIEQKIAEDSIPLLLVELPSSNSAARSRSRNKSVR
jgi:hypothetical protein